MSSKSKLLMASAAISCALPIMAQAQAADEIFVTAQKRVARAQDVPISLAAISGESLANKGVTNITQLASEIPNVAITQPYGDSQPLFVIRGITMSDFSHNQQSPVALYVDEVYKGLGALQSLQLYDLERVEVLRGPQGTLYGKNATGGTVSFFTRAPSLDEVGGYASFSFGKYDSIKTQGALNVPLSDTMAFRIAGIYENQDAWVDNIIPGVADQGAKDNFAIRGSLRYQPNDDLDVILRGAVARVRNSDVAAFSYDLEGGVIFAGFLPLDYTTDNLDWFESEQDASGGQDIDNESVSLTIKANLSDNLTLTSISSYDHGDWIWSEDTDNTPLRLAYQSYISDVDAIGQDLRLAYDGGAFQGLFGLYYNRESVEGQNPSEFFYDLGSFDIADPFNAATNLCLAFFMGCLTDNDYKQVKSSYAAYANFNYELSPEIELIAGIRYTHDVARLPYFMASYGFYDLASDTLLPDALTTIDVADIKEVDDNVSYKLGVNYTPTDNVLLYAHYSTAYRGSSFNGLATDDPAQLAAVDPEKIYAWEIGEKMEFLDRRLTVNSALFYYTYKNQQANGAFGDTLVATLFNIPKAEIYGAELDIIANPIDTLRLSFSGGYTHGRYKSNFAPAGGADLTDTPVIGAPEWTFNLAGDWTAFETDTYAVRINASGAYTGRRYFSYVAQDEETSQAGYWLADGSIAFELKDQGLEFSIWGRNLFDEQYVVTKFDARLISNQVYVIRGEPRTYGVMLTYKF